MNHPIVFIHGSGDSARAWRLQVEGLRDRHQVFAIDLPGHGQRADTLPQETTVLDYAKAAHEIIQQELHLNHPIIAGHSLGGAVALMMALEYGDELGGLILIGTGARLRVLPASLEAARTTPQQARIVLTKAGVAPVNVEIVPPTILSDQVEPASYILYRDLSACNIFDCMPRLQDIHLPTLIICGTDDAATPVKYSQYLHEHIAGSTLRIIADAGHYVMREKPEIVNSAIMEWLERHGE
ncbi:MAG: alpha/beta fold hydrolase [Ktedonobacteraceae bacterium]